MHKHIQTRPAHPDRVGTGGHTRRWRVNKDSKEVVLMGQNPSLFFEPVEAIRTKATVCGVAWVGAAWCALG